MNTYFAAMIYGSSDLGMIEVDAYSYLPKMNSPSFHII